jgi:ABC-2 type transport system permease protein
MEGYTLGMMTLYYLIVPIGNRILQGENMGFLSREIYDGTLNRYLIYPISFFHYKTLSYLTYSLFYAAQLIIIYFLFQAIFGEGLFLHQIPNLWLGVTLYVVAAFTYLNLCMMVELLALWADNIWSISVMVRFFCYFLGGSYVPLEFFPAWLKSGLAWSPFPYLASIPVRTIMGLTEMTEIATGLGVLLFWALIFRAFAFLLWKRGQFRYTGVGI